MCADCDAGKEGSERSYSSHLGRLKPCPTNKSGPLTLFNRPKNRVLNLEGKVLLLASLLRGDRAKVHTGLT